MEHETAPSAAHEAAATLAAPAPTVESHAAEPPAVAAHVPAGRGDSSALGFMFADVREDRVSQFATMRREQLFEAAAAPGADIESIVRMRPAEAGELMQLAIASKRPDVTMQLMQHMRADYLASMGKGAEAQLLFRSVLRVEGPEAAQVQGMMRWLVHERDARAVDPLTKALQPAGSEDLSMERQMLDHAAADPAWGKLYANFYDRPESAASQLRQERERDPAAFERHGGELTDMIAESPVAARGLVHEIGRLQGDDALAMKKWAVARVHGAVVPLMTKLDRGDVDFVDGLGVTERAERLMPVLADAVSQPDVAGDMVEQQEGIPHEMPPGMPPLKHVLDDVQRANWSPSVHREVHMSLARNAAEMFRRSALAKGEKTQKAASYRAARFMSIAAQSDTDVGTAPSWHDAAAFMLDNIDMAIPKPASAVAKPVIKAARALNSATTPHHKPEWTRDALTSMLRHTYESAVAPPEAPPESPAMRAYNDGYLSWKQYPELQFNETLDRKGTQ